MVSRQRTCDYFIFISFLFLSFVAIVFVIDDTQSRAFTHLVVLQYQFPAIRRDCLIKRDNEGKEREDVVAVLRDTRSTTTVFKLSVFLRSSTWNIKGRGSAVLSTLRSSSLRMVERATFMFFHSLFYDGERPRRNICATDINTHYKTHASKRCGILQRQCITNRFDKMYGENTSNETQK